MKARIVSVLLAFAALACGGCGLLDPEGELMVVNETGVLLEVRIWRIPSVDTVPVVEPDINTTLPPATSRTWQVEPGAYHVQGYTMAGQAGAVSRRVSDGELWVVPFREPRL